MARPLRGQPYELRRAEPSQLAALAQLEAASYPADEAASPENLELRQRVAKDYFWTLVEPSSELVGFVCATRAHGSSLTHESMEKHVPEGRLLCVHSVVIKKDFQRRGLALAMLQEYIRAVAAVPGAPSAIALIAKAGLVSLYVKAGFELLGLSGVVHGADPWFELQVKDLARQARQEPLLQCDAFAERAGEGNPAAVVFTQRQGDAKWMQKVALEKNLSETAFTEPLSGSEEAERFALRWFTPSCEVDLCGHATLGAAHALWATARAKKRRIDFQTQQSGVLTCLRTEEGWIQMDFPADPPQEDGLLSSEALAKALGVAASSVRRCLRGRFDILCEVSPEAFDAMVPDQSLIQAFDCRGLCVTCSGGGARAADFRSRFFAPRAGVAEDPVTGSAHCMLAVYWADGLKKSEVIGFQASARGGLVRCRVSEGRVALSGPATTTLEGSIDCG